MVDNKNDFEKIYDENKTKLLEYSEKLKNIYPYIIYYEKFQNLSNDIVFLKRIINRVIEESNAEGEMLNLLKGVNEEIETIINSNKLTYVQKCRGCDFDLNEYVESTFGKLTENNIMESIVNKTNYENSKQTINDQLYKDLVSENFELNDDIFFDEFEEEDHENELDED